LRPVPHFSNLQLLPDKRRSDLPPNTTQDIRQGSTRDEAIADAEKAIDRAIAPRKRRLKRT
jgi:hypothetical protein